MNNGLADIHDYQEFCQAVAEHSADRKTLVALKNNLISIKGDIDLQLNGNEIYGGRDDQWVSSASMARGYVVKKLSFVDSLLAKLKSEGGHMMWVVGPKFVGWIATRSVQEWALKETEEYGEDARGVEFSITLNADQWNRLPESVPVE